MTFSLTFVRDPNELREIAADPVTEPEANLHWTMMQQAINLSAGDVTILDSVPAPLYYMARTGLQRVESLSVGVASDLLIPGGSYTLTFIRDNAEVSINEVLYSKEASGSHSELVEVWRRFAEEAREFMLQEFPGLAQHPQAGAWFRREVA